MFETDVTQLSKQLSENLVAAELARRGIVATPFSGNVPDIDILAFKSGKLISVQVKSVKTGNITVSNVERDYLILKQEGNFQKVFEKKKMPQRKKDLIFSLFFLARTLEKTGIIYGKIPAYRKLFLAIINLCFKRIMI